MKQILQHLKSGELEIADVPCPRVGHGMILIQTRASLISAGTERMLVEFGQANLLQKVRQQPDKVRQVLEKLRTDGIMPTVEAVFRRLDEPVPLGYCNAGVVLETGSGVLDLLPGDRVVSNGPHAEIVCVPRNLVAKIPDEVEFDEAAFTVLGAVALQGMRLAAPAFGEKFIVFGLGLVGLLAVQLLKANGCEVAAIDINEKRLALAESLGAKVISAASSGDVVASANAWTAGRGVDGVLVTASAKTNEIMHQSAQACRQRGRIILVGVVGLNLQRSDFYEKEITFQVSCSYGPGRYDDSYELKGNDYPPGFVRWTEQRNFDAVLNAMRNSSLRAKQLISDRFDISNAGAAYEKIKSDSGTLGVILDYPEKVEKRRWTEVTQTAFSGIGMPVVGIVGAGIFSKNILLPELKKTSAKIAYIAAGVNAAAAKHAAVKFNIGSAITDYRIILDDPEVNAVFVVATNNVHAKMTCAALEAGKHVFVEKPLAMNRDELDAIEKSVAVAPDRLLMVGFNRRFSPHVARIMNVLKSRSEPLCMNMTINAGALPPDHWMLDFERSGGRIIGEACHFIDLMCFFACSSVKKVSAIMATDAACAREDRMSIVLGFADGSIGTVNYFANGSGAYPKEMIEVFSEGRVFRIENFRTTRAYGVPGFKSFRTPRQDKGHTVELDTFIKRIAAGGGQMIPFAELRNVTLASFAAVESARSGKTIEL